MAITNTQLTTLNVGGFQRPVMTFSAAPYPTIASFADVPGSDFDALLLDTLGVTIQNTGANGITYQVLTGNLPDFSDAVVATTPSGTAGIGNVAAGAIGSFSTYFLPFRYYKLQAKDQAGGSHGIVVANVLGSSS